MRNIFATNRPAPSDGVLAWKPFARRGARHPSAQGLGARSFAVGAVRLGATGVEAKGVVGDGKAFGFGDRVLAFFDFGVVKLFDLAAVQADQMVVVFALVQLKHRFTALKLAALQNAGLLKLHQYAVDSGQTNIGTLLQRETVNVLGTHMPLPAFLEKFQNF